MTTDLWDCDCTNEKALEYVDPRAADYAVHVELLRGTIRTLKGETSPQAVWSRGVLAAELKRVESVLAEVAKKAPALERAREALRGAIDASRACTMKSPALDVDSEIRDRAEAAVAARRQAAARRELNDLALTMRLPPLRFNSPSARATAKRETLQLGELAPKLTDYRLGYWNAAADLAQEQGRSASLEQAVWWPFFEVDRFAGDETARCFEARFYFAAPALEIPRPAGGLPWNRVEADAAAE